MLMVLCSIIAFTIAVVSLEYYFLFLVPVGLVLFFLCYFNPSFYVLLICSLVPLSFFVSDVAGGLGLSIPTEPMIWIAFIFFIFWVFTKAKVEIKVLKNPLVFFILLNTVWMLLTVIFSTMPFVSLKYFIARLWFISTFFILLTFVFKDVNNMRRFLTYLIYSTFILAVYTLFKHYKEDFSRHWGYQIMKPFFQDHTIYGAFLAFVFPACIMFTLRARLFKLSYFHSLFFGFVSFTLLFAIVFSYTRAAWISLIGAFVFYLLIKLKIKFQTIVAALLLLFVIGYSFQDKLLYSLERNKQGSADDLESHAQSVSNITTDPSNQERVNRWNCAILMFKERPLFGFGPGTYTFKYAPFQRPEQLTLISTHSGDLGNTHSEYFNSLSETGLIGFLSWIGIFLSSVYLGLKVIYEKSRPQWQSSLTTAVLLGLVTYYIHAFLNNYSDFDKIAAPLWGFIAVIYAVYRNDSKLVKF